MVMSGFWERIRSVMKASIVVGRMMLGATIDVLTPSLIEVVKFLDFKPGQPYLVSQSLPPVGLAADHPFPLAVPDRSC
jgi:hypothetical protein